MSYITQNTVNRSHRLKCMCCNIPLPMGTVVWFKMSLGDSYLGVMCIECGEKSIEFLEGQYYRMPSENERSYFDENIDISQD